VKVDNKDLYILDLLQKNCRMTAKEIARIIDSPVTTVFARIKRMEELGIIKGYNAVLDAAKLNKGTTAFILASVSYGSNIAGQQSQREIVKEIAKLPEVQETHIITGDWDIIIKVKEKEVATVGKLVIDKLRLIKGIEKTLTAVVFETAKETTALYLGK
jgi:Lrp/AsnC family leucine-responsive transcriptional regulator